jgi:putative cardiolipin synthase
MAALRVEPARAAVHNRPAAHAVKGRRSSIVAVAMSAAMAAAVCSGCARLPPLDGRSVSHAPHDTSDTRLGSAVLPLVSAHPGRSGVFALHDAREAFAARTLLADEAERTIDAQYYIWRNDVSGGLLFDALRRAADRGVRVRLLLDDNNTAGLDGVLAALDRHPNIEVRLFNPFVVRRLRLLGYLTDFDRLNRRMHNKSFTVDNQVTIVGGRNVGDEYFGARRDTLFVDLDVMAIGPVVPATSDAFDQYWASESAYPADRLLGRTSAASPAPAATPVGNNEAASYAAAVARLPFVRDLLARRLDFEWARTELVSDDPAKALGRATDTGLLLPRLRRIVKTPEKEMQLVSPYFVPTAQGAAFFSNLARSGVAVAVLTNSLAATDVPAVHAGYAKRRKRLLEAGVTLYELKRLASPPPTRGHSVAGSSSATSLHAKTFSVDRAHTFVGSFNFDPRSALLNTELGFVIDSPVLATAIAQEFAKRIPAMAYRLRLGNDGAIQWVEEDAGEPRVFHHEPNAGFWRRIGVSILSLLPIEGLL